MRMDGRIAQTLVQSREILASVLPSPSFPHVLSYSLEFCSSSGLFCLLLFVHQILFPSTLRCPPTIINPFSNWTRQSYSEVLERPSTASDWRGQDMAEDIIRKLGRSAPIPTLPLQQQQLTIKIESSIRSCLAQFSAVTVLIHLFTSILILQPVSSAPPPKEQVQRLVVSLGGSSEWDACHNFTIGDTNKGEFYSPGYPNNYPNSTDCTLLITAPYGNFIRVDFRDQFSLEESETCEYDRLEIRDGQFGYSDLLDVICGHNFPTEISSTDRHLWLRFKSDESIEYSGFRAVYTFIPLPTNRPEPPACYFNKTGASGYIRSTEIPDDVYEYYTNYDTPIECIWNITVQPEWQMYVNFNTYLLVKPNNCSANYIDIYENVLSEEKRKARFCGTATEPQKSEGHIINVRFHAKEGIGLIDYPDRNAQMKGRPKANFQFEIIFTAFRTNDRDKCNPRTEFDCDDGTCIDLSLKCNGAFNCKYRYDEDAATTCLVGGKGVMILTSDHMVIILIVFFALVVGMCASIIVSCWGKIQERRQRELEYKLRRSHETSVEQGLDRTMTVTSLDKGLGGGHQSEYGRNAKTAMAGDNVVLRDSLQADEDDCYVPDMELDDLRKTGFDEVDDESYSPGSPGPPPPQVISINCPLYHQHQQQQLQQQHHSHHHHPLQRHDSIRSGSESPIPPPPPPPALSHLRGRVQVI